MINLLRMDLRRLFHSSSYWAGVLTLAGIAVAAILMMWYVTTPGFSEMATNIEATTGGDVSVEATNNGEAYTPDDEDVEELFGGMDYTEMLGSLLVSGAFLAVIVALYAAVFVVSEFDSGYSKNVFSVQRSRSAYFVSKAIAMFVIAASFVLIGTLAGAVAFAISGLPIQPTPAASIIAWLALVVLCYWVMAMLSAAIAWLIRNKTAAIVTAALISSGAAAGIISLALRVAPSWQFVNDYLLTSAIQLLGGGLPALETSDIVRIVCIALGFFVASSAVGLVALKRKDVV